MEYSLNCKKWSIIINTPIVKEYLLGFNEFTDQYIIDKNIKENTKNILIKVFATRNPKEEIIYNNLSLSIDNLSYLKNKILIQFFEE